MPGIGVKRTSGLVGDQEFMSKLADLKAGSVHVKSGKPAKMSSFKNGPPAPPVASKYPGGYAGYGSFNDSAVAVRQHPKSPLVTLLRKGQQAKGLEVNRLLVTVNVLGSAGPLRFLASCDDTVQKIMETALKSYAREGRLPVLGQNIKQFELYCANGGYEALEPSEVVGSLGARNFLLCRKQPSRVDEDEKVNGSTHNVKSNLFKSWLNTMSMGLGISSH